MEHKEKPPWIEVAEKLQKMIEPHLPMFRAMEKMQKTIESHLPMISAAVKSYNEYKLSLEPIQYALNNYSLILKQVAATAKIPELKEERKQELVNEHIKWGKFGWTLLPDAPIKFFNKCPDNIQEADEKALVYCRKENCDEIIMDLRSRKIKKADLEEALFCYNNKKYKACALILFGIIESKIIRKHPPSSTKKWRLIGQKAIDKYKEKIETKTNVDKTFFLLLDFSNVIACLETMFEKSDGFIVEPPVINRNFLCHGMSVRSVLKKDCKKLFLLLRNLMDFIEIV